ncbi:MAG: RNA 2',3'-cyclic phosphodiesterase [candidate division KSB1 bacterium]|nr:RNA 2',3'-cyclic phosphodiesterase [candidate division KSB1 bacterium]MDQ7064608.1 RNA 2',3'-cyclic phosphodiesterase [candidate division KSB1 bacterium]
MSRDTIRAFICFEISDALRQYLETIIEDGRRFKEAISWTRPGNIHLTLKFLGNIDAQQREAVSGVLQKLTGAFRAFAVNIDRLGAFPNFRRPRVFWAGSHADNPALQRLVAQLEDELGTYGFEKENRRFTPHLTIGRVKRMPFVKTADFLKQFEFEPHTIECREMIFMKSELNPGGAIYTPLATFPLQP